MAIDIDAEAAKLKRHSLQGEEAERRSVSELIKAEKWRQQQAAEADTTASFGPLFSGFKPPGAV